MHPAPGRLAIPSQDDVPGDSVVVVVEPAGTHDVFAPSDAHAKPGGQHVTNEQTTASSAIGVTIHRVQHVDPAGHRGASGTHWPPWHPAPTLHKSLESHGAPSGDGLARQAPFEHVPVWQVGAGHAVPSAGLWTHTPCAHRPIMHSSAGHAVPSGCGETGSHAAAAPLHTPPPACQHVASGLFAGGGAQEVPTGSKLHRVPQQPADVPSATARSHATSSPGSATPFPQREKEKLPLSLQRPLPAPENAYPSVWPVTIPPEQKPGTETVAVHVPVWTSRFPLPSKETAVTPAAAHVPEKARVPFVCVMST